MPVSESNNDTNINIPEEITSAPSSHEVIKETIQNLKHYWSARKWIDPDNPFRRFKPYNIQDPLPEEKNRHRHMVEYIAASVLHHCFDGWTYLGRAIEATMVGDPINARHLGYYAELRGAMSILAHEGIGVFSGKHIAVHEIDRCQVITGYGTTHKFTSKALNYLGHIDRTHIMLRVVKLYKYSLNDWLSGIRPVQIEVPTSSRIISGRLLDSLGTDIKKLFESDRSARNTASYRPSTFELDSPEPMDKVIDFLKYLWGIILPNPNSERGFEMLDQQLLLYFTALTIRNIHDDQADISNLRTKYNDETAIMMDGLSIPEDTQNILKNVLKADLIQPSTQIPDSQLLRYAFGKSPSSNASYPLELLIRALLILRIATGCVEMLLDQLGPDRRDVLKFWWSDPSVRRRVWPENDYPDSFYDLRDDIDLALDNIDEWRRSTTESVCYHNTWKKCASDLSTLSTTERVFLWGIGL